MTVMIAGIQALVAEIAGVAIMTAILYAYWNLMTKTK